MRGHREGRVCKPGREFHQEPQHSVSWSWTSWPPQLWEINFYCYTQSVLFCYGSPCWLIYLSGQFSPTLFWNYDLCIPALCSHSTFFLSLLWLTSHSKYSNIHVNIKKKIIVLFRQFSSVQSLSHVRLCDPMNRSTPGLPVHHQLLEFTQTYVHWVSDAIQPSHPLSSPSPPAPNPPSISLFQWVNSSHEVAKVLEFQLQHHSFQRNPRADLLQNGLVGSYHRPKHSPWYWVQSSE